MGSGLPSETDNHGHAQNSVGHVSTPAALTATWAALMILTVLTVAATWVDLGALNVWIAMAIATIKAALVALFFMHLWYDRPINSLVFVCSLLFVMLFISLAMMDTMHYQPDLIPGYAPGMEQ